MRRKKVHIPHQYYIVRGYRDSQRRDIVKTKLTLEQAQGHCRDKQTSSSTCTTAEGLERTAQFGPWFDGYEEHRQVRKTFTKLTLLAISLHAERATCIDRHTTSAKY